MLETLVTTAHFFICFLLIGIVLLQQGKGADAGAAFGGGGQTVFGAAGADNLLTKVTTALAALFMVTSVFLAVSAKNKRVDGGNLFQETPAAVSQEVTTTETKTEESTPEPAAENSAPTEAQPTEPAPQQAEQQPAAAQENTPEAPTEPKTQ